MHLYVRLVFARRKFEKILDCEHFLDNVYKPYIGVNCLTMEMKVLPF